MAEQFLRYLRDRELCVRRGQAARRTIEETFDARAHAQSVQEEIVRAAGTR